MEPNDVLSTSEGTKEYNEFMSYLDTLNMETYGDAVDFIKLYQAYYQKQVGTDKERESYIKYIATVVRFTPYVIAMSETLIENANKLKKILNKGKGDSQ